MFNSYFPFLRIWLVNAQKKVWRYREALTLINTVLDERNELTHVYLKQYVIHVFYLRFDESINAINSHTIKKTKPFRNIFSVVFLFVPI